MQKLSKTKHLVLRLLCLFLLLFPESLLGNHSIQFTKNQVRVSATQMTIEEIFGVIEKNSDYVFIYTPNSELNKRKSIDIKNGTVDHALNTILANTNLSYEVKGKQVIIYEENKSGVKNLSTQQAQKKILISGTITDENGETLIGVSISEKSSSNQTMSDIEGKFSLAVDSENTIIVASYIGYNKKEVKVGSTRVFNIVLTEATSDLDEVIVVGYGTTTKRSTVSAISQVKAEELEELPITNVTQGLAGRSPGLIIKSTGGGLNSESTITIRGGGTPLVIIDGIARDYNDFTAISPNDIESFQVLKDASATAVYGSRASNGILQITTKRGKTGVPSINYSFNQSWSQPMNWPKKINSHDKAYYINMANYNDGYDKPYSDEDLRMYADGSDPYGHPNTDWQKLTLNDWAPQTKHNLSLTGGSENNKYFFSLGHVDQGSLYKSGNHNMSRTNYRLSQVSTITSIGLTVTAQLDGYLYNYSHPYTSTSSGTYGIFSHVQNKSPMQLAVNKNGLPYQGGDNPVAETAKDAGYIKDRNNMANGLLNLEWDLPWVKGLKLRASGNYRLYTDDRKEWRKDAAQYAWDSTEPVYLSQPQLKKSTSKGYSYTLQYFADYTKKIAQHSLNVLGGYEATYGFSNNEWLSREQYQFPIDQINPGPQTTMKNGGGESENGRAGWIGQIKYNYAYKYFLEASMRYDGSDNFPENKRWGTFYSGSVGWSLGDEAFMVNLRDKNIINMLKLRASYGQVGADNWGESGSTFYINRFSYLPSYGLDGASYVVDGKLVQGFYEGSIPSQYISWFTTDQFDMGFDFSSLNDRLYGMFDYFYYKTKGFLYAPDPLDVGYVDPLGVSLPKVKTDGEHRRAGFEMQLGWRDSYQGFSYDISFNYTKFDQLWASDPSESLESKKNPYKRTTQEKGYYGVGYENLGFYQNANDVYNSVRRLSSTNITGGDIKYSDFNGDGVIDAADQIRIGKNSFPRANYGMNMNLGYKGISLGILLQGATRFDMYLSSAYQLNNADSGTTPVYEFQTDFWRPDNTNALYPRLVSSNGVNGSNNMTSSDFWLVNGAYLRMKELRIGYNFKYAALKQLNWLKNMQVTVSAQNLFTVSDATKYGLDPETASSEGYSYPNERVFAINFNLGF